MRKTLPLAALPLALPLLCAGLRVGLRADDFKLKDGSKISGTIVGFDDNSFKVQTSYGFALVRKDQVVSITVSDASAAKAPAAASTHDTAHDTTSAATDKKPDAPTDKKSDAATVAKSASAAAPVTAKPAPALAVNVAPPAAAPVADPPKPAPPPEPIRENVDGNTYTNLTYGFRMYKPPSWEVVEGARSLMPSAIAAMGTYDQTTYLLIGQTAAGKSLTGDIDTADQRLRGLMENFRPLGESRVTVSGTQGVQRKFRGSLDQKDWSGTVVYFTRAGQFYTIVGLTVADTDLVQIQENVIARSIASLQFAQ